ncbi:hypothetical protein FB45DRAFT_1117201, partial [Roridomyces roridus]
IRWVDCHSRVPDALTSTFNLTGTEIGELPPTLFCGEMEVPMDYSKPFDAAGNRITVGFAMNRPKKAAGLIAYHAGGPGDDAVSQAWENALNLSSTFVGLEEFDFLALNTRGIQFSNPLNLSTGFFEDVSFPFPTTEAEFTSYQTAMKNFLSAAIKDSTPPGIMKHVGTVEYVQDLDAIRSALGYEKISIAALSYGSFVGLEYAARYPHRVDRMVLDAVFAHGMPFQAMVSSQLAASNRLVHRADAFCQSDPTCPFYGHGNGSVVQAWKTLLSRATQSPLAAPSCGPGTSCKAPVTATDLRQGATLLFIDTPDFPLFNIALNASLHGDASLFAYRPDIDIRETVGTPLLCNDMKVDENLKTFAGFHNLTVNARSEDPLDIVYSDVGQLILQCTVWPFPASVPEWKTLSTDMEFMWVTSDFDPNLATEFATFAWELTPRSTLVVRHGDDHTSLPIPPPAVTAGDIARNYLRTGLMPKPRSDTAASIFGAGGMGRSVAGAYDVPTGAVAGDVSS